MFGTTSVGVCLPCRNEAGHLADVVANLPAFVDDVIVVSNRSTDKTVDVARALGLTVLEDERAIRGIGYGFAHMTGIAHCSSDVIVAADADGTYPLEGLERIIGYLLHNGLDFVSCSRYPLQDPTRIPLGLRLGVRMVNAEVRLLYGQTFNDTLSGMWVFRREVLPRLHLTAGDWNLSPEIKLAAALHPDVRFAEYNIVQHRREGFSHQRYLRTGLSHVGWILRHRLSLARQPAR